MKREAIFILAVGFILAGLLHFACGKQEPPRIDPTKGTLKPVSEMTELELFQAAIKEMVQILDAAQVLDEGVMIDNEGFTVITEIRTKLAEGTPFEELAEAGYAAQFQGPFTVKPPDVSEKFVELTKDLASGESSRILQIPGHGFGILHVINRNEEDGTIDVGAIVVPEGPPPPTEPVEPAPE